MVVSTGIKPLHSKGLNGSPKVSPSPSPGSSPHGSPTLSRHRLAQSPAHSPPSQPPHSTLTTSTTTSTTTQQQSAVGNQSERQPNSSVGLVRGSQSISDRERHRGFKRPKPAHYLSSDSGIVTVSRDSCSSNEFLNDGHSGSPEPSPPSTTNNVHQRPSPPSELRVTDLSPVSSTDSPTPEDIKLVSTKVV